MIQKIGVIGAGSMGKNHARVCSELPNVELYGIVDIDKTSGKVLADRLNSEAFTDYKEMIPNIDGAIIATPTITHYDIARNLIEAGKHVLVEKPICSTAEKGQELLTLSENNNVVLAVGHIERHNTAVSFVKKSLDNNQYGDIISLNSKRVSNFPGRIHDVGVIHDFGVHDIDIMRYIGGEVKSVYAKSGFYKKGIEFEDHAIIVLNFENDLCGVIEVNWLTPMKIRTLSLTCEKSFVEVDFINQTVKTSSSSIENLDETNLYNLSIINQINKTNLQKVEPLKNEINDFVESINKNKKPLVTGYDGVQAIRIAEAALQSCKKKENVMI